MWNYCMLNSCSNTVAWPSGLRRWFKAPVSSEARVRIPPLPTGFVCMRPWFQQWNVAILERQWGRGKSDDWILQSKCRVRQIVLICSTCDKRAEIGRGVQMSISTHIWGQFHAAAHGSVAEWSKALVLGTSLFGGVGSNPTAAKYSFNVI